MVRCEEKSYEGEKRNSLIQAEIISENTRHLLGDAFFKAIIEFIIFKGEMLYSCKKRFDRLR